MLFDGGIFYNIAYKTFPKIFVIIPLFYQSNYTERNILSFYKQKYDNLGFILIDGCSNDVMIIQ
jgi:hypothetical protein